MQRIDVHDLAMLQPMHIARNAARLSSCRRRQVGAAVFTLEGDLIATGYNLERPFDDGTSRSCMEGDCPRGMAPYATVPADSPYSDCIAVHAEMMALKKAELLVADGNTEAGDLIMVVTHRPCHECTPVLERLGMQVFYIEEM